jgi:hypothetical protein
LTTAQYVYGRKLQEMSLPDGRKVWVILARSVELAKCPPRKGVIRVGDYLQSMAITTDANGGTKGEIYIACSTIYYVIV